MAVSLTSPVSGSSQNGLTSPTFTLAVDSRPANNASQWTVSSVGGTQPGVTPHTISNPFTITFWRPAAYKLITWLQGATGITPKSVPRNVHKLIVRKGVALSATATSTIIISVEVSIPAYAETYDPVTCRSALSAAIGALNQSSSGWGDTLVTGSL